MKCEKCEWWYIGKECECRFNPPELYLDPIHDEYVTKWPKCGGDDWCGEFQEKEKK